MPARRLALSALAALAVLAVAGCGSARPGSTAVAIKNYAYAPASLTVRPGARVVFTNRDATAHTATAMRGGFDTGTINPGQSRTVTLTRAGTYTFYCQFHAFMRGSVVVAG